MSNTSVKRRSALKMAGAGLVGSTFTTEIVLANGNTTYDGTVHLLEGKFPDILGSPGLIKNKTVDGDGNVFMIDGSGIFDQDGDDIDGGGSFSVEDDSGTVLSEGEWMAEKVVQWDPYSNQGSPWPDAWKGGFLELEVTLDPDESLPTGLSHSDNLNISCHIGLSNEDDEHFPSQGVRIGDYTDPLVPFTLYHYNKRMEG